MGNVIGRADYVSADDVSALIIGEALFEICSDLARQYEVWRGDYQVAACGKGDITNLLVTLPESLQKIVVDVEIALHDSGWAVAESKQLLEKLKDIGRDVPPDALGQSGQSGRPSLSGTD
jgi:hypothetical protein